MRLLICLRHPEWPSFISFLLLALSACATTAGDSSGDLGDDDDAPGTIDAAPRAVDASEVNPPDSAPPGTIDAAPPAIDAAPLPIDAAPPAPDANTGPFCTADNQCTGVHECCWKFIPPDFISGTCTYGNVIPLLGCVPADPPDAGP